MNQHPHTFLALHEERRRRLEAEAARSALTRSLRRRHRRWWRRPDGRPSPEPALLRYRRA